MAWHTVLYKHRSASSNLPTPQAPPPHCWTTAEVYALKDELAWENQGSNSRLDAVEIFGHWEACVLLVMRLDVSVRIPRLLRLA